MLWALLLASTLHSLPLSIEGNEVLPDEVYYAVAQLPDDAKGTPQTAALVRGRVETFLHEAGYGLATVRTRLGDDGLHLIIDEGKLEKVVFVGRLTFQMVRLKVAFNLPRDVFNGPQIDRELRELAHQFHMDTPAWELVPSQTVRHDGPQLSDELVGQINELAGAPLLHDQEAYELHVVFAEREWSTGAGLDLRITYFDGLELGVNYQGKGLLLKDDRWRVALMGGAGLRQDIPTNSFYAYPSRLFAEAIWYAPTIDPKHLIRPFVWLKGEGLARQRKDLGLENYDSTNNELSVNLAIAPTEKLSLTAGFGVEHVYFFRPWQALAAGQTTLTPLPPEFARPQRLRTFFALTGEYVFDGGNGRWDRRHAANVDLRFFANLNKPDQVAYTQLRASWQYVHAFGWNDLWLWAKGTWLTGDVLFPFDEPLGEHLRGVFGDIFVHAAASAHAEYRFSLSRDLFKLGFFGDLAGYGELADRTVMKPHQTLRLGTTFGPSFHVLVEGMFQLDMGLSFGFLSTGRFGTGVHAALIKVF